MEVSTIQPPYLCWPPRLWCLPRLGLTSWPHPTWWTAGSGPSRRSWRTMVLVAKSPSWVTLSSSLPVSMDHSEMLPSPLPLLETERWIFFATKIIIFIPIFSVINCLAVVGALRTVQRSGTWRRGRTCWWSSRASPTSTSSGTPRTTSPTTPCSSTRFIQKILNWNLPKLFHIPGVWWVRHVAPRRRGGRHQPRDHVDGGPHQHAESRHRRHHLLFYTKNFRNDQEITLLLKISFVPVVVVLII